MIHSFRIETVLPGSVSNAVANGLDIEHASFHSTFSRARVVSETDRAACVFVDTKIFGWMFVTVQYLEFRPPDRFIQIIDTPVGLMRLGYSFEEISDPASPLCCQKTVDVELDLGWFAYPFRGVIERLLRRLSAKVLREDAGILERRRRLFGDFIEDYLRDGQYIMFKEEFRRSFSRQLAGRD